MQPVRMPKTSISFSAPKIGDDGKLYQLNFTKFGWKYGEQILKAELPECNPDRQHEGRILYRLVSSCHHGSGLGYQVDMAEIEIEP